MDLPGVTRTIVVVDSDHQRRRALERVLSLDAHVDGFADFVTARARLLADPPEWLATAHYLGAYNGLHLAHLVRGLDLPTRVAVYGAASDRALVIETRMSGAVFVPDSHLESVLRAHLKGQVPAEDRRDPSYLDRRHIPRGGRRGSDDVPKN